ncbi:AraC family transcriptional regulator [Xanthomonas arboricola]|uniref:AraC family transcriptional regulator n=1 Tax=Xanthomonas arboricola TaxID=56448 RepID=UPI00160790FD|nr:AraC family transcriptional regulator [Xanthomonas arboricola]MBB5859041.1 hypothetical protein [Xanthomonas arboricola]
MDAPKARTLKLLRELAPDEGYNLTAVPSVRILRSDRALARTPVLYDPGIVIVCQGRKRGYFGDQLYLYDADQYLAVSVPVPFTMETDATPAHPLLALYLHLDFPLAAEVAEQIDRKGQADTLQPPQSMMSTPVDDAMRDSVLRFLEAMQKPLDAAVSPMQYVKSTRLHQARLLMVRQSLTAEAASHAVGYTSPSQFSREFRRLFGATPAAEARRMRETFAIPEAFADAVYVSSH